MSNAEGSEGHAVNVVIRNLRFSIATNGLSTNRKSVNIFDEINLDATSGQILGLIGGSGSGKTSILSVLSGRTSRRNGQVEGQIYINGTLQSSLEVVSYAYVLQEDCLNSHLTPRETLAFAAALKLSGIMSASQRSEAVEHIILELGLKNCADTLIGDERRRGCSGGEKRRVSIGIQLLGQPSVLLLDEPTTGLDSFAAYQLMETLVKLSRQGRTIITTLHQPRSDIFRLLDTVALISKGRLLYTGSPNYSLDYFRSIGYSCPIAMNPADFLIDIAAVDVRTVEGEITSTGRVKQLYQNWKKVSAGSIPEPRNTSGGTGLSEKQHPQLLKCSYILWRRSLLISFRDPTSTYASLGEGVAMGIISGWIFYGLGNSEADFKARNGALYASVGLQGFQSQIKIVTNGKGYLVLLWTIHKLCQSEMRTFDRERRDRFYSVSSWILALKLSNLHIDFFVPLIYSTIFYFMVGLSLSARKFLLFFAINLLCHLSVVNGALLSVSIARNFATASLIANSFYTFAGLACGIFVQSESIPVWVRWIKWISYLYYAFRDLTSNEYTGSYYNGCTEGRPSDPQCRPYHGDYQLLALGFKEHDTMLPTLAILIFASICLAIAFILLNFWKPEISHVQKQLTKHRERSGYATTSMTNREKVKSYDIRLDSVALTVRQRRFRLRRGTGSSTEILHDIDANFAAGTLNLLAGPSGSGKSSLLHLMAGRLRNTTSTRFVCKGRILYNGRLPSEAAVRSTTSYLTQGTSQGLFPSLTVRETLQYAAALRLPSSFSDLEKSQRADQIMWKLGLKDCADVMIGDEFSKGISGGERKRLHLGVQMLHDPEILLLDEPTSGLDAYTAANLISLLKDLATEGRTIVCAIHQNRASLFEEFNTILLLTKGGKTAYFGPTCGILPHFSKLGYDCPQYTNPSDFLMDIVSIDSQSKDKQIVSRARVNELVQAYNIQRLVAIGKATKSSCCDTLRLPELSKIERRVATIHVAFPVLLQRSFKNIRRNRDIVLARVMQVAAYTIILTLFYARLQTDFTSIQNRFGLIQELTPLYFIGMLNCLAVYPAERDVAYQEFEEGIYPIGAFFLSYSVLELPLEIVACFFFSAMALFVIGLQSSVANYFIYTFAAFAIVNCKLTNSLDAYSTIRWGVSGYYIQYCFPAFSVCSQYNFCGAQFGDRI